MEYKCIRQRTCVDRVGLVKPEDDGKSLEDEERIENLFDEQHVVRPHVDFNHIETKEGSSMDALGSIRACNECIPRPIRNF